MFVVLYSHKGSFFILYPFFYTRRTSEAGTISEGISSKEGVCYVKESVLSTLWQVVVYHGRKNNRNHLHLVSKMPKRKKNKYFRAFEPIVTEYSSETVGSISFYRSFTDGIKRSQRNLYRC